MFLLSVDEDPGMPPEERLEICFVAHFVVGVVR